MRTAIFAVIYAFAVASAEAQLAGYYTIHPGFPTGGGNFQTIGAATAALHSQPVVAPVTFQIYDDAGPWTEANPVLTFINGGTAVLSVQGQLTSGVSAANPVVFEAAPGEFPVFEAQGQPFGVVFHGTKYTTIKGVEIRNATSDGVNIYTDSLVPSATSNLLGNAVIGCNIHDIGGCGISIYQNGTPTGGVAVAFEGTVIRNNFLWRCQVTHGGGNNTWRNGYLNERRSRLAVIENNTFYADTGVGTNFGVYCTYYAAPLGGPAASFTNNVIVKTVANGNAIRHIDAGSLPLVQDWNVYEDVSGGVFFGGASGTAATFAAFQTSFAPLDANGRSGPVLLAAPATGDLHLTPGSVAIDAGTALAAVTDDIDRQPRPFGVWFDAGADEWQPGSAAVIAYGAGCAGTGGLVPALGSTQLPTLGNLFFTLDVANARPGSNAFLFAALLPSVAGVPVGGGCNVHLDLASLQFLLGIGFGPFGPVPTQPAGTASFPLPVPLLPNLAGASIYWQAAIVDPISTTGFTLSNGAQTLLN